MKTREELKQEILNSLQYPVNGLINLPPRYGKTSIVISIIKKEKPKSILWVTPNTKLRDEDIPNEFKKWKATSYLRKTLITTYASLHKVKGHYDKIILDEYQCVTNHNLSNILDKSLTYSEIVGITGTPPKHKEKQFLLHYLKLEPIAQISISEAINNKIIAPYKINTFAIPLDNVIKNIKAGNKNNTFYQTELSAYNYATKQYELNSFRPSLKKTYALKRMRLIQNLPSKTRFTKRLLHCLTGRTLIFAGSIEQAESISNQTYHSKTDNTYLNKFLNKEINHLVCVNAGGTGFTYKDIDNVIIVQTNSNMKGDIVQKITRGMLYREGYKANIYILYADNTVDKKWMEESISEFNEERIVKFNKFETEEWVKSQMLK